MVGVFHHLVLVPALAVLGDDLTTAQDPYPTAVGFEGQRFPRPFVWHRVVVGVETRTASCRPPPLKAVPAGHGSPGGSTRQRFSFAKTSATVIRPEVVVVADPVVPRKDCRRPFAAEY